MKKDINIEIGQRIKERRIFFKYTRETLAELVDISPQFLANIESGKKGMSFSTLKKLCEVLAVSCDYVILGKSSVGDHEQIDELLKNIDDRYLPMIENILINALRLISEAKSETTTEPHMTSRH